MGSRFAEKAIALIKAGKADKDDKADEANKGAAEKKPKRRFVLP